MNVKWCSKIPPLNEFGISKQLILKTSKGNYATGYYCDECDNWHCENLLFSDEVVWYWLDGLDFSNEHVYIDAVNYFPTKIYMASFQEVE